MAKITPYKFSNHENVPDSPPLLLPHLQKLVVGVELTPKEKVQVVETLWGIFGQKGSVYRLFGWAWDLKPVLKRILVKHKYSGWCEYYAPNKTSLREVLKKTEPILEMHYIGESDD